MTIFTFKSNSFSLSLTLSQGEGNNFQRKIVNLIQSFPGIPPPLSKFLWAFRGLDLSQGKAHSPSLSHIRELNHLHSKFVPLFFFLKSFLCFPKFFLSFFFFCMFSRFYVSFSLKFMIYSYNKGCYVCLRRLFIGIKANWFFMSFPIGFRHTWMTTR